jgi:hypothetical protein
MTLARVNSLAMLIKRPLQLVRVLFAVRAMARGRHAEQRLCAAGSACGFYRNISQPFSDAQEGLFHAS